MATYWENSCSFGLRYVSWYKNLTVSLFFSHLGFWSGNLFLIAPFPDLCLLVPFPTYKFLKFVNQVSMKFWFRNLSVFNIVHAISFSMFYCFQGIKPLYFIQHNIKFVNPFIVYAIKFRKCLSKFMTPLTLLQKFGYCKFFAR